MTQLSFSADIAHLGYLSYYLYWDTATNIIGANPAMVAPTMSPGIGFSALAANFALSASPCINMGDTTGSYPDTVDFYGNPRIIGSAVDIGAFEYNPYLPLEIKNKTIPSNQIDVYPNPANNLIYVSTTKSSGLIKLTNYSGNTIANKQVVSTLTFFEIHTLPRGIYFAIWDEGNGEKSVQKVVVE